MSKSVEELFRNAPSDATHYLPDSDQDYECWVKSGFSMRLFDQKNWRPDTAVDADISNGRAIPRPAKPWSGPEDGLPPVGLRVMVHECSHDYTKKFNGQTVRIVGHDRGDLAVFAADNFIYHALIADKFKLPPTAEQIAHDQRETAIRDVMDIAQVDCRVTAARLVDAGFKREVV